MKIQMEFNDYEEMMSFARQLLGEPCGGKQDVPKQSTNEAAPEVPAAGVEPIPAVPVQPQIPVQPQTPAPIGSVSKNSAPTGPAVNPAPTVGTMPVTPNPVPAVPASIPTTAPTYSAEELQVAAMSLMDKGMMVQLQGLLQQFGVNSLPDLPPDKYGAFATALRGMGAQI